MSKSSPRRRGPSLAALTALALAFGYLDDSRAADLADLSLEQLGSIEVTSVSRRAERLVDAPASIYVITNDDIRRSGARTVPEALRLAPNLQVARTGASTYAISARGFNNSIGNKLLVLIDGRTVYTPLFSGVFWDQQDVMLEDVERIEVISGPGGTLWGANAMNGVINVITRSSADTRGGLVSAGTGTLDRGAAARFGGRLGENGSFRVYGRGFELQNTRRADGMSLPDGWERGQAGFRADWSESTRGLTVQGDAYRGQSENRPVGGAVEVAGMNLLARWNQRFDSGSDIRVQGYFDRSSRDDRTGFQGDVDTFDLEFQHGVPIGRHKVLWGAGYRQARDSVPASVTPLPDLTPLCRIATCTQVISFDPPARTLNWTNVFVQGDLRVSENVELTAGVKVESNDYTGWETLPSMRIAWKPAQDQLVWSALSRAVRAPARLDTDFRLNARVALGPVTLPLPLILGGPNFQSEVANVLELGYRAQPTSAVSYSVTAFHSRYDKLRSGRPPPAFIENNIDGFENGVEAWGTVQVTRAWRLSGGFSTLRQHLGVAPGVNDPTGPIALGNDPDHQWVLRSAFNIGRGQELDIIARRVGSVPLQAPAAPVPAYTAVDVRWGCKLGRDVEVSLTVQNLFDPSHPEFNAAPGRSEYERGAYMNLLWRM